MELATCTIDQSLCTIVLDDGKANAMSTRMIEQISAALDRAEAAQATVILTGRAGVFSGGFDLGVFKAGGDGVVEMLSAGAALAERMLSFPLPIVIACSGHAMAMGLFVVLCGDYRIGLADDTRVLRANEVAIGLTMPLFAVEVLRQRLTRRAALVTFTGLNVVQSVVVAVPEDHARALQLASSAPAWPLYLTMHAKATPSL